MSKFSSETHINLIRARLIGLRSPAARTFSKKIIDHKIISKNDKKLQLLDTFHLKYRINYIKTKFSIKKITSIITAGHRDLKIKLL